MRYAKRHTLSIGNISRKSALTSLRNITGLIDAMLHREMKEQFFAELGPKVTLTTPVGFLPLVGPHMCRQITSVDAPVGADVAGEGLFSRVRSHVDHQLTATECLVATVRTHMRCAFWCSSVRF